MPKGQQEKKKDAPKRAQKRKRIGLHPGRNPRAKKWSARGVVDPRCGAHVLIRSNDAIENAKGRLS